MEPVPAVIGAMYLPGSEATILRGQIYVISELLPNIELFYGGRVYEFNF